MGYPTKAAADRAAAAERLKHETTAERNNRLEAEFNKSFAATAAPLAENPKDRLGVLKVSFTPTSNVARIWWALAMADGARKYGLYNWRNRKVKISVYIDAAERHLLAMKAGEDIDYDPDAPPLYQRIPHAGRVMACMSIIEDARAGNVLDDDRSADDMAAVVLNAITKASNYGKATKQTQPAPAKTRTEAGMSQTFEQFLTEITQRGDAQ